MRFFRRHAVKIFQILQVTASDGNNQRYVRFRDPGNGFDFPEVIGSHFKNADLMFRREAHHVLRNSDLIVRIALRRKDVFRTVNLRENRVQSLFRAGFAAGTGQRNDFQVLETAAVKMSQFLIGAQRRVDQYGGNPRRKFGKLCLFDAEKNRAVGDCLPEIIVPVEILAGKSDEKTILRLFSGVRRNGINGNMKIRYIDELAFTGIQNLCKRKQRHQTLPRRLNCYLFLFLIRSLK